MKLSKALGKPMSEVGAAASVCLIDPHLQPSPERSVDLSVSGGAQQERAVDSPWS